MMKVLIFSSLLLIQRSFAAYCNGSPDPGIRTNANPILEGEEGLKFIKAIENASLYEAGPDGAKYPIVHVYGSPYEMGYAQGALQKEYMREFVSTTYNYLLDMVIGDAGGELFPVNVLKLITLYGMNAALDWTAEVTAPFTPQQYYDELRGLADGSGIEYKTLLRANMIPELTKASCSFFGAWGSATSASDGHTYQLRALDYDTDGPFKNFPQVTVYHPSEGHPFLSVSWPGIVGVLTGASAEGLALSEIGITYPDDSFGQGTATTGPEKVKGEPWMFVTRDVLQFEDSLTGAIDRVQSTERTCNLVIGFGDGEAGVVNGIEYSGQVAIPYNDSTLLPANETWHGQIIDVVYNGMDWLCESYNSILGEQLREYHGSIDAKNTITNILPTLQSGDLHIALYDLTEKSIYLSFMDPADGKSRTGSAVKPRSLRVRGKEEEEGLYAYERQFTKFSLQSLFQQPAPVF